jgi:hypothetical protein
MFGVAHLFYHWQRSIAECALLDGSDVKTEVGAVASSLPLVDLLGHTMNLRWSYPVFVWMLREEDLFDVVMGRIRLFAQFDIEDFVGRIEALGLRTSWVTGRKAENMKQRSDIIPGSPNARALCVESGKVKINFLSGFFGRLFTELMTPGDLLRMLRLEIDRASSVEA